MSTQLSRALERIKVLDVGHEKLEEYIKEVRLEAHNAALEQAAKICDDNDSGCCAAMIRAMKKEKIK